MLEEKWIQMKSPYNKYKISNFGKIVNTKTNYQLSISDNKIGYVRVALSSNNKMKKFLLHRLVAEYFLDNFLDELVVHHIDSNPFNNRFDNLDCITQKKNNKLKINAKYGAKSRSVAQYDLEGNLIKIWERVKDVPSRQSVLKCLNGTYKTSGGYKWEYYFDKIEGEIWKNVNINNNKIMTSDKGRVKSKTGKICYYTRVSKSGYGLLSYDSKTYSVHRLICMSFKPNDDYDKLQVNHKDLNKLNNNIDNLEWVTPSENMIHCNSSRDYKKTKTFKRRVRRIDNDNNIVIYSSLEEAVNKNNLSSKGTLVLVCQGKRKTTGGYKWEYV